MEWTRSFFRMSPHSKNTFPSWRRSRESEPAFSRKVRSSSSFSGE